MHVEVGGRRGRRLGQKPRRRVGVPSDTGLPGEDREERAEPNARRPSARAGRAPARAAEAERHVDGDRSARRQAVRRARTTSVVGSGLAASRRDPADVTGPASRCAPSAAWSGPFGQSRKTSRPVGRSGVKRHVHRPRHVSGGRDAHREPVAGPGRVGRRIRGRRAGDGEGGAAPPRARCRRSARGRGRARGQLPPRALAGRPARGSRIRAVAAPPPRRARRFRPRQCIGRRRRRQMSATCGDDLARERLAVDPALGGDAELGAVEARAPGPASAATSAAPGTASAPSAISIAADPAARAGPGALGGRQREPPQPLLELGDLARRSRPSAARTPPPRRRGRGAGSARRAPRPARRRPARRRAPSRRPAPPSVDAVPPTPITIPQRAVLDRSADQLARRRATRRRAGRGGRPRPAATRRPRPRRARPTPSIRRANRAVHGRPSASWTSASRHSPAARPRGAPRPSPRRRRPAAPRRRRRRAAPPASPGEGGRRLVGGVRAAQLVGGDDDPHDAPNCLTRRAR